MTERSTPRWPLALLVSSLCWLLPAPAATAQTCSTTVSDNGTNVPTVTTPGTVICITANNYTRNITIDAANCTVNFNGGTYSGSLTVTANGRGCIINNNGTVSGSNNVISAAVTINNNAGANWTGNFYSGIAPGSTVNNAGTWGTGSSQQFSPLNGLTINNTGTWNAISYGVQTNPVTISNAGSWQQQLGTINTSLTLTNEAGATWSQALQATGSNSLMLTNHGTWTAAITFPSGTNWFLNRAGATATIGSVAFGGTTSITNGGNGGGPTLTFSSNIAPTASTSIINYGGTVNTNAGLGGAGSIDNRSLWNASTFGGGGPLANSGTLRVTGSFSKTGGTMSNSGTLDLTAAGATFAMSGGSFTNAGNISVAASLGTSGSSTLTNNGTITTATYSGNGTITNNAQFTANTSFANTGGSVTNNAGATISTVNYTNSGTTTNAGMLNPTQDFTNNSGVGNVVNVNSAINPGGNYINRGLTNNAGNIRPGGYILNENSGATLTNNGTVLAGSYFLNRAIIVNNSDLRAATSFESESSGSVTNNAGARILVGTDFTNNSPFTNNGSIYLSSASGTFLHKNGAAFTNAGYIEVAGNFTNAGNFNGAPSAPAGAVRVSGVSQNTGFTFGGSGLLDFCDTTPGAFEKGFNAQSGGVGGAVTSCNAVAQPLPVKLIRFSATLAGQAVDVRWATASELNSAYFTVQRSFDGVTFEAIGRVTAAGHSTQQQAYLLRDKQLPAGAARLYYRLHQVDQDGSSAYSDVQIVALGQLAQLTLAPNPTTATTTLSGLQPGATAEVFNLHGQRVGRVTASEAGTATLTLPALPAGVYLVKAGGQTARLLKE